MNFTYSPDQPKAGTTVMFTNQCDFGESWTWTFGDNSTSMLKNPSHVYKKAGEYQVTLMVDSTSRYVFTKTVTVYDTVPSISSSSDSILVYSPVTFTALVWNPFDQPISYEWIVDSSVIVLSDKTTDKHIRVLFTRHSYSPEVTLNVTLAGETYSLHRTMEIHDTPAQAILFRTDEGDYYQRLFPPYLEEPHTITLAEQSALLDAAAGQPDTIADPMARKLYFRTINGLYVCNTNLSNQVLIEDEYPTAFQVDMLTNRLYWATGDGIWRLPLIYSQQNTYTDLPERINSLTHVNRIILDNQVR